MTKDRLQLLKEFGQLSVLWLLGLGEGRGGKRGRGGEGGEGRGRGGEGGEGRGGEGKDED